MILLNWNKNVNEISLIHSIKHYNLVIGISFDRE